MTLTDQHWALLAAARAHPDRLVTIETDLLPGRDVALIHLHQLRDRFLLAMDHARPLHTYKLTLLGERSIAEREGGVSFAG